MTDEMIKEIINEKIKLIKKETGNNVRIEVDNTIKCDAILDFDNWNDMTELPKIKHKTDIDGVHILHELIHLEKFFIDKYSLIAYRKGDTSAKEALKIFKNIPEDYVAHKIIKNNYSLDPIDKRWFRRKDNLRLSDEQIAANLVNFYAFSEFCPEYKEELKSFKQKCMEEKVKAHTIAERAIVALESTDYNNKESYDKCAEEIIKIFSWDYYTKKRIYLSYLSKEKERWHWNP